MFRKIKCVKKGGAPTGLTVIPGLKMAFDGFPHWKKEPANLAH